MADWYKPIAKHVFCPFYAWKDGSTYLRYLKEFEKTQYLSRDEVLARRWTAIQKIVSHAYDHCRYYREKYSQSGFHPDDLKNPQDFETVPSLSKAEIQKHVHEMVADNVPEEEIIANYTGGSTGSPLQLYLDRDRKDTGLASTVRHNRWSGLDLGDKLACLWGATTDMSGIDTVKARLRNRLSERILFLDTSRVTRETLTEFVNRLRRFRPRFIQAYAQSITSFARYVKERTLEGLIQPHSIITSAEVLTKEDRELVESVFQCKVFDRYGCREASLLASECEKHEGMHINAESIHLEFVRGSSAAKPGELGQILLTDLRNRAMPLIRYQIGDAGVSSDKTCSCGRGLPLMQMAAGRVTDFLVTAEGDLVSGVVLSTYLITKVPGLKQVQFYQDRIGHVLVRLVQANGSQELSMSALRDLCAAYLGSGTRLEVQMCDEIPSERSGKFRFTISTLDPLEQVL